MAELEMRLGVGFTGKIEFVVNWNETIVYVLGFCVGIVASRSFWACIFRFSDRASGNLRSVLLCGKTRPNGFLFNIVSGRSPGDSRKRSDNKWYTVEVRWGIFIENMTVFFFIPESGRKYSCTNSRSYNFAMTSYFARWSSHSWTLGRLWNDLKLN